MKIISGIDNIYKIPKGTISTIGVFDGLHRGHLSILNKIIFRARLLKTNSLVITFSPHPYKIIKPQSNPPLLISLRHRLLLIEKSGVDYCLVINFNRKFALTPAETFIEKILSKALKIREIYIGENFRFGWKQEGGIKLLKNPGKDLDFAARSVAPVKYRGKIISSSWIREEIKHGNLGLVSKLIGRPLSIYGQVIKGEGRGKELGFPTANLNIEHEAIPPMGVYAVRVFLENRIYVGLLNIGHRPTFVDKIKPHTPLTVEVYLFNFKGSLYGRFLEVAFVERLRPEKKFSQISHLIAAMKGDELKARRIFSEKRGRFYFMGKRGRFYFIDKAVIL